MSHFAIPGYHLTVLFWLMTIVRYLVAAVVAAAVAASAVLGIFSLIYPKNDSPILGVLWFMLSVLLAGLFVPVSLGFTGEIIERKVQRRPFRWGKAWLRSLLAIPIMFGPVYAFLSVQMFRPDARNPHWAVYLGLLSCVSVTFVAVALRIRRIPTLPRL
jgi:MFS family permease